MKVKENTLLMIFLLITTSVGQAQLPVPARGNWALQAQGGDMADEDVRFHMWRGKMEPVVRLEFSLANRVCKLDSVQREKIGNTLGAILDKSARVAANKVPPRNANGAQVNVRVVMGQAQQDGTIRETLIEQVQQAIEPLLDDEQQATYKAEVQARNDFLRETTIDNVISMLDKRLALTNDQTSAIRKALLADDWVDTSPPPLHAFLQNAQYIPQLPGHCITPHLNKAQSTIYNGLQKVSWGQNEWEDNIGFGNAIQPIDDVKLPPASKVSADSQPKNQVDEEKP